MPFCRVTLFFSQSGYGWSESLWQNMGPDDTLATFAPRAVSLAQKRAPLLGAQGSIIAARLSVDGVFRDALYADIAAPLVGTATQVSDAPDTAILVDCSSIVGTKHKKVFLRGVWDSVVDLGGTYVPSAAWQTRFNAWAGELINGNWGWLTRSGRVSALITGAVQLVGGNVGVTLGGPLTGIPFGVKTRVQISGVKGAYQLNGSQLVVASAVDAFATANRISIFPYTAGGRATWSTPAFQAIQVAVPGRIVERKVGRPSYKSPGRRKGTVKA